MFRCGARFFAVNIHTYTHFDPCASAVTPSLLPSYNMPLLWQQDLCTVQYVHMCGTYASSSFEGHGSSSVRTWDCVLIGRVNAEDGTPLGLAGSPGSHVFIT